MNFPYVVVGAGLAGCTVAERLAASGREVLVVEKRPHIAGNAYDTLDDAGLLVKPYGPHIFHTSDHDVWEYLNRFTSFNGYEHRVLARVRGLEVYLPVNVATAEILYGRSFTGTEFEEFLRARRLSFPEIRNSREMALSQVGEELYELFFRHYTRKQWGVEPEELDPEVLGRLPVRFNRDTRYFTDPWQGIPRHGYTRMCRAMLDHPAIHLLLQTDYFAVRRRLGRHTLVFTGPIDSYFSCCYGPLPYRSLEFRFVTLEQERFQNAAVVNYPNDHDYTRITEFKHFYGQVHPHTTVCYEYPRAEGEPYYPIPRRANRELYQRYQRRAEKLPRVHFVGRLAEYRYLNMDQVVGRALQTARRILERG